MQNEERMPITDSFAAGGTALVDFARSLTDATSLGELERAFRARFGRLMTAPMYGFYALDREGSQIEHNVAVNVSDVFVDRYVRKMEVDPLLAHSQETKRPVYNLDLMSEGEWAESEVYRGAYFTHSMQHVLEVPIVDGGELMGALHCGSSEPRRNFTQSDLRIAEAAADVLALSIRRIRSEEEGDRALEEALVALELTGTALISSRPRSPELRPNEAARALLEEVVDSDEHLHRLLARPTGGGGGFSRRVEVSLRNGRPATLHAHTQPVTDGGLVTVLELQREHPALDRRVLSTLTPRESEIAVLVADGLSDREIAERLFLSRFTVHQHVKRIYRSLDVDSRVSLTRLLLGAPLRRGRDHS
jgi:DNA-binding CsgD family transcriptional regulator/GAF domain-containing protein